jgi:hypothetical protein
VVCVSQTQLSIAFANTFYWLNFNGLVEYSSFNISNNNGYPFPSYWHTEFISEWGFRASADERLQPFSRVETLGYKFAMPTALFSFQLPCFQTSDTRQLLTATREKKLQCGRTSAVRKGAVGSWNSAAGGWNAGWSIISASLLVTFGLKSDR